VETKTVWTEKMKFTSECGVHKVGMDAHAPIGTDTAMTPKELVVVGIAGCTAMDVVSWLKKHKEPLEDLEIDTKVNQTEGTNPRIFKDVLLIYKFKGALNKERVLEAVHLSQTLYCGVSAMIAQSALITYEVILNGNEIGRGEAKFEI